MPEYFFFNAFLEMVAVCQAQIESGRKTWASKGESRTETQTFLLLGSLMHEGPEKASSLVTTHTVNQNDNNNNNDNSKENKLSTSHAVY